MPGFTLHNLMSGGPELFSGESHLSLAVMVFRALNVGRVGKAEAIADKENGNGQTQNQSDNKKFRLVMLIEIGESFEQQDGADPEHQELHHIDWIEG